MNISNRCIICFKRNKVEPHQHCEVCLTRFFPKVKFEVKVKQKKGKQ